MDGRSLGRERCAIRELLAFVDNTRSGLTDRYQVEDNCLLSAAVLKEVLFLNALYVLARQPRSFQHMSKVVIEAWPRLIAAQA